MCAVVDLNELYPQALVDICHKVLQAVHKNPSSRAVKKGSTVTMDEGGGAKTSKDREKPFDSMNSIVANMLLNMTGSAFTTSSRILLQHLFLLFC